MALDDDDDDDDDDITVHIIVAVCLGVFLIVVAMTVLSVIITCHWRRHRTNQDQFRHRMVIN